VYARGWEPSQGDKSPPFAAELLDFVGIWRTP
jgi:hypothetical protein